MRALTATAVVAVFVGSPVPHVSASPPALRLKGDCTAQVGGKPYHAKVTLERTDPKGDHSFYYVTAFGTTGPSDSYTVEFWLWQITGLSGGPNFLPVNPRQTHYQFEDNLFWTRGNHTLKFGVEYRHLTNNVPFVTGEAGEFRFRRRNTGLPGIDSGRNWLVEFLIL